MLEPEQSQKATLWSRLALGAYWVFIVAALAWVAVTRSPNTKEAIFVVTVAVLAAALPMERHAGRLRLRAVSWQVDHDQLTGLPNRAYFMSQLSKQMRRKRHRSLSLAILILDLDRFKTINDTLGHAAGDRLLQDVGGRLKQYMPNHLAVSAGTNSAS